MADKDELIQGQSKEESEGKKKKDKKNETTNESDASSSTSKLPTIIPNLYNRFVQSFENAISQITEEPKLKCQLKSLDLDGIAELIKGKDVHNILFMVGAGISTSAGVPDFRSPKTGLYENLAKYKLPDPQAVFQLDFFRKNPEPFYKLARELFPETLKPTPCHYFMRLLEEKKLVRRIYTQNIDSLEYLAGINPQKIVAAHGSHQSSTCLTCNKKYDLQWITNFLKQTELTVAKCSCGGLIKPDIVFFGEALPSKFFTSAINDFPKCDLLIIIGTSLVVQPFASMIHEVAEDIPRLLINLTPVGKISRQERAEGFQGLCYGEKGNIRDVFWQGAADDGIWELSELLGIKEELDHIMKHEWSKIDRKVDTNLPVEKDDDD